MSLRFVKTEAAGNDLVLVDFREQPRRDMEALAVRMCDRHFGVGGDGLLTLERGNGPLPFMRMFNPDGTEDFCGNGLRCVAAWLWHSAEARDGRVLLETPRGKHDAVVESLGARRFRVGVQVVVPQFDPAAVPVRLPLERVLQYALKIGDRTWPVSCVSIGTAHTVIFGDADVEEDVFREASPLIEQHRIFPERTSVLWCRAEGRDRIRMRIWERGVGESFACGTGTCAAVVVGRTLGLTGDRAEVVTRGGSMSAEWSGKGPVRLIGPARIVYVGNWVAT